MVGWLTYRQLSLHHNDKLVLRNAQAAKLIPVSTSSTHTNNGYNTTSPYNVVELLSEMWSIIDQNIIIHCIVMYKLHMISILLALSLGILGLIYYPKILQRVLFLPVLFTWENLHLANGNKASNWPQQSISLAWNTSLQIQDTESWQNAR